MPLQQTTGNVTTDAYGGGVAAVPNYIEDVFSTYLYTGNGSTQTITNGIDLSGKGGLVWIKNRNAGLGYSTDHALFDTARGATKYLISNATASQTTVANSLTSFNSTGFSLGADGSDLVNDNTGGNIYASWTFREQPKFFDVVTYTGNGTKQDIAHSLASAPGCIMVKRTDSVGGWLTYHRSGNASAGGAQNTRFLLQTTNAQSYSDTDWASTQPTSTVFTVGNPTGSGNTSTNISGATYVAYLFAHDAGGFGLTGTDNVISCGSFTTDGSGNATVNLGYEPQWVLFKPSSTTGEWTLLDTMRGWVADGTNADKLLYANNSDAEVGAYNMGITATGFDTRANLGASTTYIYIAIRRGPMKVPTSGTSVFSPNAINNATGTANTTGFPIDLQILDYRSGTAIATFSDRLRGVATTTTATSAPYLFSSSTAAEASSTSFTNNWGNTGFATPSDLNNFSGILWNFRRAPNFFDEVCYTGTGSATTFSHNLGVAPELMIVKSRSAAGNNWIVYSKSIASGNVLFLNGTAGSTAGATSFNSTAPTASVFTVGTNSATNGSGATLVAYLFATCAGVSKVGSYTGNGSTQTINCGFTGGARFVLIKRTDSTGDWYVYDTARGMTTLTDPYLLLNSTAAESATLGSVTTVSTGFAVNASILAAINTNGASYIFLAIS